MNRKQIILTLLLFISFLPASAERVSEEMALDAAQFFFNSNDATKAPSSLHIVWNGVFEPMTKSAETEPLFYVISRDGGGFVIISADDRRRPVLGFSFENDFKSDNMPDNVRWMMEMIGESCRKDMEQTPEEAQEWASLMQTKASAITKVTDEFLGSRTLLWNQSSPFNIKAPESSPTGCLPLALAEILTFHKAPLKGDGSFVGGYDPGEGSYAPEKYKLDTSYDWDSIKQIKDTKEANKLWNNPNKKKSIENLAQLILDCGALVEASYEKDGTGAYESKVPHAFGDHMGYNKSAHLLNSANYEKSEWISMLKEEITQRPVLYCGVTADAAGHAFVADGYATYNKETVFHFNFGWGGSDNGYYFYTNPSSSYDFCRSQTALFDFYPYDGGSYINEINISTNYNFSKSGMTLKSSGPVEKGKEVYFSVSYIEVANGPYHGRLKLCLEDRNGNIKQTVCTGDVDDMDPGYLYTEYLYGYINKDLEMGDRLVCYYSTDENCSEFERIKYPVDGTCVGEYPVFPVTFIRDDGPYSKNSKFVLQLKNNDYPYEGSSATTEWRFISPSGKSSTYGTSDREVTLNESGNWKVTATVREKSGGDVIDCITATIKVK